MNPREILDNMFHAEMLFMEKNDDSAIKQAFHPDIVVHEPESLPYAGDWSGYQELKQLWRMMNQCWESIAVEDMDVAINDNLLFLRCKLVTTSRKSAKTITQPFAQSLTIEDGLVKDVIPFYFDTSAIHQALHADKQK
jgi:hypothetical protein